MGDLYLVLGAPWSVPGAAEVLARTEAARRAHGVADPRPDPGAPAGMAGSRRGRAVPPLARAQPGAVRPGADHLTVHRGRRGGLCRGARDRAGGAGPGSSGRVVRRRARGRAARRAADAGQYVLFVSTLEARKNHALAVKVWHKLLDEVRAGVRAAGVGAATRVRRPDRDGRRRSAAAARQQPLAERPGAADPRSRPMPSCGRCMTAACSRSCLAG